MSIVDCSHKNVGLTSMFVGLCGSAEGVGHQKPGRMIGTKIVEPRDSGMCVCWQMTRRVTARDVGSAVLIKVF